MIGKKLPPGWMISQLYFGYSNRYVRLYSIQPVAFIAPTLFRKRNMLKRPKPPWSSMRSLKVGS